MENETVQQTGTDTQAERGPGRPPFITLPVVEKVARQLNRQELCTRYGWKFASNLLDVYISRIGMDSRASEAKFTQAAPATFKSELAEIKQAAGARMTGCTGWRRL